MCRCHHVMSTKILCGNHPVWKPSSGFHTISGTPALQLQQKVPFFLRLQGQDHHALSSSIFRDSSRTSQGLVASMPRTYGAMSMGHVYAKYHECPQLGHRDVQFRCCGGQRGLTCPQSLVRDGFIDPNLEPLEKVRKEKLDF